MKVRSFCGRASKSDLASHLIDQSGRDDKAESGATEAPAGRSFRLNKRLKQAPLHLEWNSNPRDHYLALLGELDRVRHQVVENLAQPARIPSQTGRHVYVHIQGKLDPFGVSSHCKRID